MQNSTKIIIGVVVVALIITGIWYYGASSTAPTSTEPIKVGAILPLTGKASNVGVDIKMALDLAATDINSQGKVKVELQYQDEKCNPADALSAYQVLRGENVNIIIGPGCSPSTLAVAPIAQKDHVVMITPASSAETLSGIGGYIFRNHTHDKAEVDKLAPFVIGKYKKVAMIYDNTNDAFVLAKKYFKENFESLGGQIVVDDGFQGSQGDYRTELAKIKQSKGVEAIVVFSFAKDGIILVKQMREIGLNQSIIANKTFASQEFVKGVGNKLAEGIVYAEAEYNATGTDPFWSEYQNTAGKTPTVMAAQGYDSLKIIALALGNCQATNSECAKNFLHNLKDYPGVAGALSFDSQGNAQKNVVIKTIKNGQFVPLTNN